jgi:hypothetical protein
MSYAIAAYVLAVLIWIVYLTSIRVRGRGIGRPGRTR